MLFKKDDYIIILCLIIILSCIVYIAQYCSQTFSSVTSTLTYEQKIDNQINHIKIDKINLDLDIIEDKDENNYYLSHTIDNKNSISGSLFYYSSCSNIIYGHNMLNGTMFGRLKELCVGDSVEITINDVYLYKINNIYYTDSSYFPNSDLYDKNKIYLSTCNGEGRMIIELERV